MIGGADIGASSGLLSRGAEGSGGSTPSPSASNPALAAELERLIAEQAKEDTDFVSPRGAQSLDAPLGDEDGGSLYEVIDERDVEVGPAQKQAGRVTAEQIKEWRGLRRDGWTYQRIADYAGVATQTVRHHISKRTGERRDSKQFALEQRFDDFRGMYESGAFIREIAEIVYEEVGFASWQSCYQGLRKLFIHRGVAIRPRDLSRRARSGRPAPNAPREEWQRFWKRQSQKAKERRQAELTRCDAIVKAGRPCRRWAIRASRYCMTHDERARRQPKWTKENVLEALRTWAEAHGRAPRAQDWANATDEHPNFKTAVDLFGKWNFALYEAGLRKRKHTKPRKRKAAAA